MRFRPVVLAVAAIVFLVAIGVHMTSRNTWPAGLSTHLRGAGRITVFQLDPDDRVETAGDEPRESLPATVVTEPADAADAAGKLGVRRLEDTGSFHGYKVVRVATVAEPEKIMHLVRTLERAMAENVSPAKCFIPDYGIRFTLGDRSEELLLSLKCLQFSWERRDADRTLYVVADLPGNDGCRAVVERLLDEAGNGAVP